VNLKGAAPERFGRLASRLYRVWGEPTLAPTYRRVGAEVPIESGRLLDVGCGPGRLARLLAAANPDLAVVGLDASPSMVREARRGPSPPNLEFREGRVEDGAFENEFDFVLALLSFHHWEDPSGGLEAVHRALKPGGRFWIYESDPEASDEEIRRDHAPLWGWLRMPPWLERLLSRGHGFSQAEIASVVRPLVADTPFGECVVEPRGSTWRIALQKASAGTGVG